MPRPRFATLLAIPLLGSSKGCCAGGSGGRGRSPSWPPADAAQVLRARVKLLKFPGGRGYSFVTAYAL
jgi:hypothetical protein